MSTINKIAVKNSLGEYDESKIGAQAEDIIISRDADGKIIETIETPGVVIGSTEGVSTTIKEIDERIATTSSIGQVQIGTGFEIDDNGILTPSFGNTTGSICEGNDPRLAGIGTVANDLVLSSNGDGDAAGATFNGGAAVKISYNSIGAAPNQKATTSQWGQVKIKSNSGLGMDSTNGLSLSSHASASTDYGKGTNANYGHLKIVDATIDTSGTNYNAATGVAASASSVASVKSELNSNGVDGVEFYFDYKDGKYGWNESSARGTNTFHPFKQPVMDTKTITEKTTTDLGEDHTYRYIDTTGVTSVLNWKLVGTLSLWKYNGAAGMAYCDLYINNRYVGKVTCPEFQNNTVTPQSQTTQASGTFTP